MRLLCKIAQDQLNGKVYAGDMNGNVETQLRQVFSDVAAILKLRLTL